MGTVNDERTRRVNDEFRKLVEGEPSLAALFTVKSPRYRYFPGPRGVRYCWNVEPVAERDGKWFAWEYRPVGRGARTGKDVTRWEMKHRVRCGSRTAAKERARRWVQKAERVPA